MFLQFPGRFQVLAAAGAEPNTQTFPFPSVSLSVDNVQGVLGQFVPVLDESAIGPVVEEAGPVAAAFGIPLVIVPGRAVSY